MGRRAAGSSRPRHAMASRRRVSESGRARERVLSDEELQARVEGGQLDRLAFRTDRPLAILTGARRDEVAQMEWREVDFDRALWTLPVLGAKTVASTQFRYPTRRWRSFAHCRGSSDPGYVFTTNARTPVSGFSKAKPALDRAMDELAGEGASPIPELGFARPPPDGGDESATARRSARSDRSGLKSCVWQPSRDRWRLSKARLCRGEEPGARRMGEAAGGDRERARRRRMSSNLQERGRHEQSATGRTRAAREALAASQRRGLASERLLSEDGAWAQLRRQAKMRIARIAPTLRAAVRALAPSLKIEAWLPEKTRAAPNFLDARFSWRSLLTAPWRPFSSP